MSKKLKIIIIFIAIIIVIAAISIIYVINNKNNKEDTNIIESVSDSEKTNEISKDTNTDINSDENDPFLMYIDDVFTIIDKGTAITGQIKRGTLKVGDEVQIIGLNDTGKKAVVTGIEQFRKNIDSAKANEYVAVYLSEVEKKDVQRGQVIASPDSITATNEFEAEIYLLSKEDGGIQIPNGYTSELYIEKINLPGTITIIDGKNVIMPGETGKVKIKLENNFAVEVGTEIAIREDNNVIGSGKVTKINK